VAVFKRFQLKVWGIAAIMALSLMVQACAPQLSPQSSCNFVMSNEAQRVSWGAEAPVILYVDSSVPSEFFGAIQAGVNTWNQSLGREVLKIGGWSTAYPTERQDGVNVIYFKRDWPEASKDKQAVTTIHWAGDRIFEADISVNGNPSHYVYFWGPEPIPRRVDFESLLLHELGHVLGLDHSEVEVAGTVMAKKLMDTTTRRQPVAADVDNLRCEY